MATKYLMGSLVMAAFAVLGAQALTGCGGAPFEEDEGTGAGEDIGEAVDAICKGVILTNVTGSPVASNTPTSFKASGATCAPGEIPQYRFMYRRQGGPSGYTEFRPWGSDPNAVFDNTGKPSGIYTIL